MLVSTFLAKKFFETAPLYIRTRTPLFYSNCFLYIIFYHHSFLQIKYNIVVEVFVKNYVIEKVVVPEPVGVLLDLPVDNVGE